MTVLYLVFLRSFESTAPQAAYAYALTMSKQFPTSIRLTQQIELPPLKRLYFAANIASYAQVAYGM